MHVQTCIFISVLFKMVCTFLNPSDSLQTTIWRPYQPLLWLIQFCLTSHYLKRICLLSSNSVHIFLSFLRNGHPPINHCLSFWCPFSYLRITPSTPPSQSFIYITQSADGQPSRSVSSMKMSLFLFFLFFFICDLSLKEHKWDQKMRKACLSLHLQRFTQTPTKYTHFPRQTTDWGACNQYLPQLPVLPTSLGTIWLPSWSI